MDNFLNFSLTEIAPKCIFQLVFCSCCSLQKEVGKKNKEVEYNVEKIYSDCDALDFRRMRHGGWPWDFLHGKQLV